MDKKHKIIKVGLRICCLILSNRKDFRQIAALSDAWLPTRNLWVGEYPYLLKPAFQDLCRYRIGLYSV